MFKEKQLKREYYNIINIISLNIDRYIEKDIIGKEMIVVYDDIIPDLFIKIPIDKDVINRYDLSDKVKTDEVLFDVYADRIKSVNVHFPNGKVVNFDVSYIEEMKDDMFYSCVWQVPLIQMDFNGIILDVSLLKLIKEGAKVYIRKYEGGIV